MRTRHGRAQIIPDPQSKCQFDLHNPFCGLHEYMHDLPGFPAEFVGVHQRLGNRHRARHLMHVNARTYTIGGCQTVPIDLGTR